MKVEYRSNNSGGEWWLSDDEWRNLEAAGWKVDWFSKKLAFNGEPYEDGRFLRALASRATREGLSMDDAIAEFERITGENANSEGCPCCGAPHYFDEVSA